MKAGKYTIKELFLNRYVERILIPEIQRDYVWGKEQVEGLFDTLMDSFKSYNNAIPISLNTEDNELQNEFNLFLKKRNHSASVGFIYAYHDSDYPGRYYLIDGQQRITTIILLLITLASGNDELRERFEQTYMHERHIKLDYKVRQAAHDFFNNFINHILTGNTDIQQQRWYYSFYKSDVTIRHILDNHDTISKYLNTHNVDASGLYDYIEYYTEMWYFDTNISEQGEELYIYMNARGEQVQANENIKADLLGRLTTIEEKDNYGKEWEEWQDFFWKNKGGNPNADKGFNEFLACISGIQKLFENNEDFYSNKHFEELNGINVKDIMPVLKLDIVKKHIQGLQYLMENKETFKKLYKYSDWVDISINSIWGILNKEKTNWFANYRDENRGTERNRMVYMWGVLSYLYKTDLQNAELSEVFRVLRLFYIRFNNFNRSVASLERTVKNFKLNGIYGNPQNESWPLAAFDNGELQLTTEEENAKKQVLIKLENEELRRSVEELIWEIEDHPYNLNGKDVGGTNITHLLSLNEHTSTEELQRVKNKFYELFPIKEQRHLLIQNVLLHYGRYWYRVTPVNYTNLKFDDWYKIIRNRNDQRDSVEIDAFELFWREFLEYEGSITKFYALKKEKVIAKSGITKIQDMLLWYNQALENKMWQQGNYIAYSIGWYCGLPDWENNDAAFPIIRKLYNTKGDLKGGVKQELYILLPESAKLTTPTN